MKNTIKYPLVLLCVTAAAGLALSATFALTYDTIRQKQQQKVANAVISAFWNVETPEGATWKYNEFAKVMPDGTVLRPNAEGYDKAKGEKIYVAYTDGKKLMGYATIGSAAGYSSTIRSMTAVKPLGNQQYQVLGIKVVAQQETPGLGARVEDVYTSDTLWTALGQAVGASEKQKPVESPQLTQAGSALNVSATTFPARPAFQAQFAGKVITVQNGKATGLDLVKSGWSKVAEGQLPKDQHTVVAMTGATISSNATRQSVYDAVKKINAAVTAVQAGGTAQPTQDTNND